MDIFSRRDRKDRTLFRYNHEKSNGKYHKFLYIEFYDI